MTKTATKTAGDFDFPDIRYSSLFDESADLVSKPKALAINKSRLVQIIMFLAGSAWMLWFSHTAASLICP